MAKDLQSSLKADLEKLQALQARIADKRARLAQVNRKTDTRRKVMTGAYVLDCLTKNPEHPLTVALRGQLDDFRGFLGEANEGLFPEFFEAAAVPEAPAPAA
ncbi:hypothetical protein SAMN02745126_06370 [Enhydrobacter aerosaccus]|uniref:Relaxasome subunit MobC n=1 Tax=Enhydrobacter aerosaccus TaxID=225324 RepID=A0A1T4TJ42_9HYPH|nr:hypothetical protein [Enhydrobacter aerosaccus]SKA40506.1 hypothetical protein SAMN02745126_06370 [Enhydrobacter aerosaccus]